MNKDQPNPRSTAPISSRTQERSKESEATISEALDDSTGTPTSPSDINVHQKLATQDTVAFDDIEATSFDTNNPFHMGQTYTQTTVLPITGLLESTTLPPVLEFVSATRYEIKRQIGQGAMGSVFLAFDRDIQRMVALKRLNDPKDPVALARLTDEVRIGGYLDHPNIVPVHDVGCDKNGEHFFVMRFIEGTTLSEVIEGLKAKEPSIMQRFPLAERIRLFRNVVATVAYAHRKGVLHADLKPDNLMVAPHGEIFVMDWGIARYIDQQDAFKLSAMVNDNLLEANSDRIRKSATDRKSVEGTPFYMAPEQVTGHFSMVSEVYTLGVIFHELLGLKHYLEGKNTLADVFRGVREIEVPTLFQVGQRSINVPIEWSHFVTKCTRKDPDTRFGSVPEMLDALERVADGHFPIECPTTLFKQTVLRVSRFIDRYPELSYWLPLFGIMTLVYLLSDALLK